MNATPRHATSTQPPTHWHLHLIHSPSFHFLFHVVTDHTPPLGSNTTAKHSECYPSIYPIRLGSSFIRTTQKTQNFEFKLKNSATPILVRQRCISVDRPLRNVPRVHFLARDLPRHMIKSTETIPYPSLSLYSIHVSLVPPFPHYSFNVI
jgi:hypothetical protein